MNKISILSCIILILISCKEREDITRTNKSELVNSKEKALEDIKFKIFQEAILNESTIQDFVVVKVHDKNTGEGKEIATFGNFLKGAIHLEYDIDYSEQGIKKANEILLNLKSREITLSKAEALKNISFNSYTEEELNLFKKRVEEGNYSYQNDKEMTMLAHLLFNKGIKSSENNCFGGKLIYQTN